MPRSHPPKIACDDRWFKMRGYPHFDRPVGKQTAGCYVKNVQKVRTHSFFPFISYVKKVPRYDRAQNKVTEKERPIAYAAHMDSHIYAWYSQILSERYEQKLQQAGCAQSILAYRKLGRKCNIHFAAEVFQEVARLMPCVALAIDISKFFDKIDHALLKRQWEQILDVERLPDDHFAVFNSITSYSSVDKNLLYKILNIQTSSQKKPQQRLCSIEDFRAKVRGGKLIRTNVGKKGIPQGSPMSAVLSNIYMLPFDKEMHALASDLGGVYRRYCDDILMIVPATSSAGVERRIMDAVKEQAQEVNSAKTERRLFLSGGPKSAACSYEIPFAFETVSPAVLKHQIRQHSSWKTKPLQYLGFLFDGSRTLIRTQSIARYYRRMKVGVHFASKHASENPRPEERKIRKYLLYETYSHLGAKNFIRYGYRASSIMNARGIRKQLKKHWKSLHRQIEKKSVENEPSPSRLDGPDRCDQKQKEESMAGKKASSVFDISALFEQELQARNEDLRRQAALSMLPKLRPSARVTMAEFLDSLQQHREVWSAVLEMPAVEFASLIAGSPRPEATKDAPGQAKRTRISDAQKNSLKGAIVSVLGNHKDGLSRTDIAGQIGDDVLATIGVKRDELADKLRQPLGELVADNKIHTVGEKRLMRYHAGPKK